jgi:hypothetical protein
MKELLLMDESSLSYLSYDRRACAQLLNDDVSKKHYAIRHEPEYYDTEYKDINIDSHQFLSSRQ